jgi:hypothetical protein
VSAYVDRHRVRFGVEPICKTLEVSASAYCERRRYGRPSKRSLEDERLLAKIRETTAPGSGGRSPVTSSRKGSPASL